MLIALASAGAVPADEPAPGPEDAAVPRATAHERLAEMTNFFETMSRWYTQMRSMPTGSVIRFVKMGDRVRKLLGIGA